ncbi:TRAP transporter small permease [bacterium]|nr:TRAP transporter small permease [bacterium]
MKKNMLVEELFIAVLLMVMVLLVVAQVFSRYVFHTSISYTEELVRYGFVWATFFGIAAAAYRDRHLSISISDQYAPRRLVRWSRFGAGLLASLFAAVILVYGVRVVLLQAETHQTTAALGIPMWIVGLAVPVSAVVLVIRLVLVFLKGRGAA